MRAGELPLLCLTPGSRLPCPAGHSNYMDEIGCRDDRGVSGSQAHGKRRRLLGLGEVISARLLGEILPRCTRVLAATRRAPAVDCATAQAVFVIAQEFAGIGELAALTTAVTGSTAVVRNRQQGSYKSEKFVLHTFEPAVYDLGVHTKLADSQARPSRCSWDRLKSISGFPFWGAIMPLFRYLIKRLNRPATASA